MDRDFKAKLIDAYANNTATPALINEAVHRVSDLLETVYQHMEQVIKTYLTHEDHRDTTFFILSDHGFSFYPGGYNHYGLPDDYPAPDGFLMIHGPEVKPGELREKASIYDIVPSILYLYNYAIGKDMDGRPLKEAFRFNRDVKYKIYKLKKEKLQKRDKSYDEETLKELESLGYISREE
jgi:membrane-anchored protein YejM (alkaline phosphatase superfamily)